VTVVDASSVTFDILDVTIGSTSGIYVVKYANPPPFDDPA
jgi:hypothetical protein